MLDQLNNNYIPIGDYCVVESGRTTDVVVEHSLDFFMNSTNVTCVIEFYIGSKVNSIFTIDLAGRAESFQVARHGHISIPYSVVSPDHPLLKRLVGPTKTEVAMANRGEFQHLLQPSRIISPSPRDIAKVTCGFHEHF